MPSTPKSVNPPYFHRIACVCMCVCVCVAGKRKRDSTMEEHNGNEICYRPNFIVQMPKGLVLKLVSVCKSTVTTLSRDIIHSI